MPLDVRGCTRATMGGSVCVYPAPRGAGNPLNPALDRDRGLQLFPTNEEFPVGAGHEPSSIKSLPFVHTARRYYRSDGLARSSDRPRSSRALAERREDKRGSPEEHCHHPPPEKRVRVSADTLSDVEDSNDEAPQYQDEVAAYIDHKTPKDDHFEILSWWKDHAHLFPNIAQIARSILAIPASSAASERGFSCAGYVIQERRSQLKQSTVDDVLFLHSNLKHHHHK
ncbi:hypothetical protein E1301_Tti021484 [Triplophysa tibetana]|uniref:HAT C-terminal dimerisation domain-containing protein n=1 Tax=Triplophysa tibetana TaxID=1572043 RepID=A0A5A9P9S9_9TELE|nr:hypothetical protein E1301_Tti021484 [Triplophysa tibetana]